MMRSKSGFAVVIAVAFLACGGIALPVDLDAGDGRPRPDASDAALADVFDAPAQTCPIDRPKSDEPCTLPLGTTCGYGSAPPGCPMPNAEMAECTKGRWVLAACGGM